MGEAKRHKAHPNLGPNQTPVTQPVSDTYLGALVDFDLAFEAAREVLIARIADSMLDVDTSDILNEGEDGVFRIDRSALTDLPDRLEEASMAIRNAHNGFNRDVAQAYHDLKTALANAPSTPTLGLSAAP
jgi:hypothetical protein